MHIDRRLLIGVVCLACSPGCTLTGAGIGALVSVTRDPVYEERAVEKVQPGDRVAISASGGRHLAGRLAGRYAGAGDPTWIDPPVVLIVDSDGEGTLQQVPTNEIESIKVDAADRKWWLYGGVIGLVVDVAIIAGVAYVGAAMSGMK